MPCTFTFVAHDKPRNERPLLEPPNFSPVNYFHVFYIRRFFRIVPVYAVLLLSVWQATYRVPGSSEDTRKYWGAPAVGVLRPFSAKYRHVPTQRMGLVSAGDHVVSDH